VETIRNHDQKKGEPNVKKLMVTLIVAALLLSSATVGWAQQTAVTKHGTNFDPAANEANPYTSIAVGP
jgi:hypothetical protein